MEFQLTPGFTTAAGPKSAKDLVPRSLRSLDARKRLALRISDAIRASGRAKGDLMKRIRLNEDLYQNKNVRPARLPWRNAQHFHIPMLGPRLQQRKANIVASITSQDPVFRFSRLGDSSRSDRMEQTFQYFLDLVGWRETLDQAIELAMPTNMPIWRVSFQHHPNGYHGCCHTGEFAGLVFDIIHVDCYARWPANGCDVSECRLVGHCFEDRKAVVRQKMRLGEYLDDGPVVGSDPGISEMRDDDGVADLARPEEPATEEDDESVVLWDVIWRDDLDGDGVEELYRVVLRETTPQIFLIEPYPHPFHCYVEMPIRREWGKTFAEGSPVHDVQGLQLLLNSLVNEFIWGMQMASRPPVLTEGWQLDSSMVGYEPGEYRNVRNLGRATPVPVQFNPSGMDFLIQAIKSFADSATKTSDTITGAAASSRDATATEENIKFQAFQLGSVDDITAITPALRRLVMISVHLLAENFHIWKRVYGDAVPIDSVEEFHQSFIVELAGRSGQDSPQLQSQQAQTLLQLAATFPQSGIPLNTLIKSIVTATSLPNKEDILRGIEAMEAQRQEFPNVGLDDMLQMAQGEAGNGQGASGLDLGAILELAGMAGGGEVPGASGAPGPGSALPPFPAE